MTLFLVGACGSTEADDDGTAAGGASTGGQSGADDGGEIATGGGASTDGTARPSGKDPLVDGFQCPGLTCEPQDAQEGDWEIVERCDVSGTWLDPSCPAATFGWQHVSASGLVTFTGSKMTWTTRTVSDWQVTYPARCGGCSMAQALAESWDEVSCSTDANQDCACTGRSTDLAAWSGTFRSDDERGSCLVEQSAPGTPPEEEVLHPYLACFGGDDGIFVDDKNAHFRMRRVED